MKSGDRLPLHQQNPTERFSNRATDYAKYRPTYPPAAIAAILADLGDPAGLVAADVGAGTGISARLLADRGVRVVAIEPNATMRAAALSHSQVEFQTGTAEQTGLADRGIDLVVCCQSFHWFDQPAALTEFRRILRPGGRVALMWNDRDETDPFTQAHAQIINQFAERAIYDDQNRKAPDALVKDSAFGTVRSAVFQQIQRLDRQSLIGLALSSSYLPTSGAAHAQLLASLNALVDRWADPAAEVALAYRTYLYLAETQ